MKKIISALSKITWRRLFIGIGIIATFSIIISLFVVTRPQKKNLVFSEPLYIDDGSFLSTLSRFSDGQIIEGGKVEVLSNGDEFYPQLFTDIKNAQSTINFSVYIWKNGKISDELFDLLTEKANEGLSVRIILDGFGAKKIDKDKLTKLKNAGAKIAWFHPLHFGYITKYHKRNHVRAIIIDDVAYTGGAAVSDYWQGNAEDKDHWRDFMFRLTGPQIKHVQTSFTKIWEISSGEVIANNENDILLSQSENSKNNLMSISLTSIAPNEDTETLSTHFAGSIFLAKKSIIIATPYLILDDRIESALLNTAKRGVAIRLLLPGPIIDSKIVQSASQHYYTRLLKAGIKIYEYQPTMLHSKYMVIDNVWSIIGSANLDTRSTFFNTENIIDIQSKEVAQVLTNFFEEDLIKSKEVNIKEWQKRGPFRPIFELTSSLIDKQL